MNTILRPEDVLRKPGSCGLVAPGIELAILDDDGNPLPVGEPASSMSAATRASSTVTTGIPRPRRRPSAETGSRWETSPTWTRGFYYICDRKRDMIISGGVNIYPAEIEDVLHRHPDIEDVGVFGVPDDEWGERVHAAVQPRPAPRSRRTT